MNLYVSSDLSLENAKQITQFKEPSILGFYWLPDNKKILLLKDHEGTTQFRLYLIHLDSLEIKDLTQDFDPVTSKVIQMSSEEGKAIIGIKNRNPKFFDLYLLDLNTNELSLYYQNDQFLSFLFDAQLNLVLKVQLNPDSSLTLFDEKDQIFLQISPEDAFHTECLAYAQADHAFYLLDNRNSNTTKLKKIYLSNRDETSMEEKSSLDLEDFSAGSQNSQHREVLLGNDVQSDITAVYFEEDIPIAYCTYFTHQQWHPLHERAGLDINFIISQIGPNFQISDQSRDHAWWILKNTIPDQGIEFWLYHRPVKKLSLLYRFPKIKNLAKMYPIASLLVMGWSL